MKSEYLVDTNIFLRFILNDHKTLSLQAAKYFKKAKNNQAILITTNLIIAELIWVLKSVYQHQPKKIYRLISQLLHHKNIYATDKEIILKALEIAQNQNVSFIDACNLLTSRQQKIPLITFDKKLLKLEKSL